MTTNEDRWIELVRVMVDQNEFKAPGPHSPPEEWVQMPWARWVAIDSFVRAVCRASPGESVERDAARYRLLRDPNCSTISTEKGEGRNRAILVLAQLDAAIDAAMSSGISEGSK